MCNIYERETQRGKKEKEKRKRQNVREQNERIYIWQILQHTILLTR